MKKIVLALFVCFQFTCIAQGDNVFLDRSFWKTNPSVTEIKDKIKEGNDPSELTRHAFDGVVYALLEKTNDKAIKYLLSLEGNPVEKQTHDSRTYIFWAAYAGKKEIMKHLLERGAKLNIRDSHGNTPVTFAASTGQLDLEVYSIFEKYGLDLSTEVNEDGANALLLIAPYAKDFSTLSYFINKGISLESKDNEGYGIFLYAAKGGNQNFMNKLIQKGVSFNKKGNGGNAMYFASLGTRGNQNGINFYTYLAGLGIDANTTTKAKRNPLHRIANNSNDLKLFDFFTKKGVDVNLQDNRGTTPFMIAANSNTLTVIKHLMPLVTNINVKDNDGKSALAMAINTNDDPKVAAFLIKKGADPLVIDIEGNTLSYYLLNSFNAENPSEFNEKLELLISSGVAMDALQHNDNTLLHLAVKKNDLELIKSLKKFNIPVNAINKDGLTALHIAAMTSSNVDILKYLVANGADKTQKTTFDETVFELAKENELLQKQNVKLNFLE